MDRLCWLVVTCFSFEIAWSIVLYGQSCIVLVRVLDAWLKYYLTNILQNTTASPRE
ncbi:Hypothetical protein CINCED_3A013155 [Cinara cedri]|uniref:Uncharacterized protein n=1 Tax=Cinara cedri TaxID=506608 RepID=A0A5E4N4T6_9HEMI|nr:Hypothetical protein CINCED_3A013155 [Cinara cedri]